MSIRTIIFVFFLSYFAVFAQETELRIIFAGDLMGHTTQINAAQREAKGKGYNYKPFYQYFKSYFSAADLAVINLEHTLAGPPYAGYPQFSSPDESIFAIKDAGFDLVATANNHSLDRGKQGLERTVSVLDSIGMKHFGIYRDTAEKKANYPLIVEKNNIKLAFLNYTYGTNMLVEEEPNIVNRIDSAQILTDIKKAQNESPDFIIAFMHWGNEYENKENEAQRELAQFMALNGVNMIIGSHPHVVQPLGKIYVPGYKDSVLVMYSLGNFISNQRDRYKDGGIIFEATLLKNEHRTKVINHGYVPFWVYRFTKDKGQTFRLLPDCKANEPPCKGYKMKPEDRAAMKLFFEDTNKNLPNLQKKSIN
ncbi:MAG: CapA family protein [Fibromonadales bacterium]|nr:CapA family protein [Fibromonadales bacterium]